MKKIIPKKIYKYYFTRGINTSYALLYLSYKPILSNPLTGSLKISKDVVMDFLDIFYKQYKGSQIEVRKSAGSFIGNWDCFSFSVRIIRNEHDDIIPGEWKCWIDPTKISTHSKFRVFYNW